MTLRREVINLIRFHQLYDPDQRTAIRHITIVQLDASFLLNIFNPLLEVEMLDTAGIEIRGTA